MFLSVRITSLPKPGIGISMCNLCQVMLILFFVITLHNTCFLTCTNLHFLERWLTITTNTLSERTCDLNHAMQLQLASIANSLSCHAETNTLQGGSSIYSKSSCSYITHPLPTMAPLQVSPAALQCAQHPVQLLAAPMMLNQGQMEVSERFVFADVADSNSQLTLVGKWWSLCGPGRSWSENRGVCALK